MSDKDRFTNIRGSFGDAFCAGRFLTIAVLICMNASSGEALAQTPQTVPSALYQHDPSEATSLAGIRWMANGIENVAAQTYFTRDGDRHISSGLIRNLLDKARDLLAGVTFLTDDEWMQRVGGERALGALMTRTAKCPEGFEDTGGQCILSSTSKMPLPEFGFSVQQPMTHRVKEFHSSNLDPIALTEFRWMTNALENAAIQTYLGRVGNRVISGAVVRDVLFKTHDAISEIALISDAEARSRFNDVIQSAQRPAAGCPGGWKPDPDNGYCTPCIWAKTPCTTFGMPLKLTDLRY